jgi:redox-sensitive bicupin YhaK (pirin superfamily)
MSAGTGLTHSEFNLADKPVHFYQIWIFPDEGRLDPSYDQKTFDPAQWKNRLLPVASGQGIPDTVTFHTDATIYRAALDAGTEVVSGKTAGRRLFAYVTTGRLDVNGAELSASDQARADVDEPLRWKAIEDSEFIVIDVPSCKGWGYAEETLKGSSR